MYCQCNLKPHSQYLWANILVPDSHQMEMGCFLMFCTLKDNIYKGQHICLWGRDKCAEPIYSEEHNQDSANWLKNSLLQQGRETLLLFSRGHSMYYVLCKWPLFLVSKCPLFKWQFFIKVYISEHINFHLTIGTRLWGPISVPDKKYCTSPSEPKNQS